MLRIETDKDLRLLCCLLRNKIPFYLGFALHVSSTFLCNFPLFMLFHLLVASSSLSYRCRLLLFLASALSRAPSRVFRLYCSSTTFAHMFSISEGKFISTRIVVNYIIINTWIAFLKHISISFGIWYAIVFIIVRILFYAPCAAHSHSFCSFLSACLCGSHSIYCDMFTICIIICNPQKSTLSLIIVQRCKRHFI